MYITYNCKVGGAKPPFDESWGAPPAPLFLPLCSTLYIKLHVHVHASACNTSQALIKMTGK